MRALSLLAIVAALVALSLAALSCEARALEHPLSSLSSLTRRPPPHHLQSRVRAPSALPEWPEWWSADWTMFDVPADYPTPPYTFMPPPPYAAGRGKTYYDWSRQSMTELYYDFCVPIFPAGNNWTCQFLNTNNISYLISADPTRPPCCVFGDPWFPPPPDFAKNLPYNDTTEFLMRHSIIAADWYTAVLEPDDLTFGYGFVDSAQGVSANVRAGDAVPAAFYFNAVNGWCQQNFVNFNTAQPDPSIWNVPDECKNAPTCVV